MAKSVDYPGWLTWHLDRQFGKTEWWMFEGVIWVADDDRPTGEARLGTAESLRVIVASLQEQIEQINTEAPAAVAALAAACADVPQ